MRGLPLRQELRELWEGLSQGRQQESGQERGSGQEPVLLAQQAQGQRARVQEQERRAEPEPGLREPEQELPRVLSQEQPVQQELPRAGLAQRAEREPLREPEQERRAEPEPGPLSKPPY